MIWWLFLAFIAGFVLALYLARNEFNLRAKELNRLRKKLAETQIALNDANRLLHGDRTDPDWWKRN